MKRAAYITDLHLEEAFPKRYHVDAKANWLYILADVRTENISEIVIGGDIGEASAHPWFFESLQAFRVHLTLGNHDVFSQVRPYWRKSAASETALYYSEEDEWFRYIFLDSSTGTVGEEQLQWLRAALETEKNLAVFIHHPVLPVASAVDRLYPLENRDEVRQVLLSGGKGVTLFCGHYHFEDERSNGRLLQYISPAASFQIEKEAPDMKIDGSRFGYRIIGFGNKGIATTIKRFGNKKAGAEPGAAFHRDA